MVGIKIKALQDWGYRRKGFERRGLLLLAGLLSGLAFAPFFLFPLLALGFGLLLWLLGREQHLWGAFAAGWFFAFGQFFCGLIWIAPAFVIDGRFPAVVGYLSVAGLAGGLALYGGLVCGLLWWFYRRRVASALKISLSFVLLWSIGESLRGHLFTGFPWNLSGYIWGFSDIMLQSAALWGIYGLGLVTVFLGVLPYLLLCYYGDKKVFYRLAGVGVFMVGGLWLYGFITLSAPTEFRTDVTLKIVQANIALVDKWEPAKKADNFITYLNMSKSRGKEKITHVIWPETAVIYFLDQEPSRRHLIADILPEGSQLITGFPRVERKGPDGLKAWNSSIIIDDKGDVQALYDKHHLVPFGEYTPAFFGNALSFLGLGMLADGLSYSAGTARRTLIPDHGPALGILICYEIIFPGAVLGSGPRPDWLVNLTNDAWYGDFNGPYQHLLQTRVRAIEEGLPIVRSAGTGISAVIDSYGRIIQKLGLNEKGVIISALPAKKEAFSDYNINSSWLYYIIMICLGWFNILFQRR